MKLQWLIALALPAALAGCEFEHCETIDVGAPAMGMRNPDTGMCEYYGGGGSYESCGDDRVLPAPEPAADAFLPTWGQCESECTGLDFDSCLAAAGCQAAFTGTYPQDSNALEDGQFFECWDTADGYNDGRACGELNAWECSSRDDCIKYHYEPGFGVRAVDEGAEAIAIPPIGGFAFCGAEPTNQGCYSDQECGPGYSCTADTECLPPPGCDPGEACPAVCYGTCVPDTDPGGCQQAICEEDPPVCPTGTIPGVLDGCYTGACIPESACGGTNGPGLCYVVSGETCPVVPPECPDGTLPGFDPADGCPTGYCIPLHACEAELACSELPSEETCVARPDCTPLYTGTDCTCNPTGCVCDSWNYTQCN